MGPVVIVFLLSWWGGVPWNAAILFDDFLWFLDSKEPPEEPTAQVPFM